MLFNYPRGAGRDIDCAPDSAGNRRNPAGQGAAWGRSSQKSQKIDPRVEEQHFTDVEEHLSFVQVVKKTHKI